MGSRWDQDEDRRRKFELLTRKGAPKTAGIAQRTRLDNDCAKDHRVRVSSVCYVGQTQGMDNGYPRPIFLGRDMDVRIKRYLYWYTDLERSRPKLTV